MKDIIIVIFLVFSVSSCFNKGNEQTIIVNGDFCYFSERNDTLKLGNISFKKEFFQSANPIIFSNIQKYELSPKSEIDILNSIEGIYINSKMFDSFVIKNGKPQKNDNSFDILFIYPEVSRYNFQFNETLGIRIFHYFGFLYAERSNGQNLSYYVQSIKKTNNNNLLLQYIDKSTSTINSGEGEDKLDSLDLSTFPKIKFNFSNKNLESFQSSKNYIKLSDEIIKEIKLSLSPGMLPQDINELYLREIVTKLVNINFRTNFSTNEIIEEKD